MLNLVEMITSVTLRDYAYLMERPWMSSRVILNSMEFIRFDKLMVALCNKGEFMPLGIKKIHKFESG